MSVNNNKKKRICLEILIEALLHFKTIHFYYFFYRLLCLASRHFLGESETASLLTGVKEQRHTAAGFFFTNQNVPFCRSRVGSCEHVLSPLQKQLLRHAVSIAALALLSSRTHTGTHTNTPFLLHCSAVYGEPGMTVEDGAAICFIVYSIDTLDFTIWRDVA